MEVTLFLNHACNMACTYCYNGAKFQRTMPREVMKKGVEMSFFGDYSRVSFFGGEPLLEEELLREAVAYARSIEDEKEGKIPLRFSMTTNGTLVTEDVLGFLANERFHLVFSLDGCRGSHELTRPMVGGESSFDLIVENLKRAACKIPAVETIMVVDPTNVSFLADSFTFIRSLGVKNLNFSLNYEAEWSDDDLAGLERSMAELGKLYVEGYRKGEDFSLDLLDSKVITHLKGGYACRDRCRFGDKEMTVAPTGKLYPCERLVGEDTRDDVVIGDVWKGPDLNKVAAMAMAKNQPDQECEECSLKHRCMFWCGCVNYATTGSVGETSGILCRLEQMTIAAADEAARTLYAEENPMFIAKYYCSG